MPTTETTTEDLVAAFVAHHRKPTAQTEFELITALGGDRDDIERLTSNVDRLMRLADAMRGQPAAAKLQKSLDTALSALRDAEVAKRKAIERADAEIVKSRTAAARAVAACKERNRVVEHFNDSLRDDLAIAAASTILNTKLARAAIVENVPAVGELWKPWEDYDEVTS